MMNIDKYINWMSKHKKLSGLIVLGLFLFPLVTVHFLFKWKSGFDLISSEWSAGDLIGYIAGFEAFAGTLILGVIAVWQTDKANKTNDNLLKLTEENERKSVLPFLSFNSYLTKYVGENIISLLAKVMPQKIKKEEQEQYVPIEDNSKRIDFLITELYFTIANDSIKARAELTEEQQKKISSQFGIKKHDKGGAITVPDYYFIKINIENCGRGSAINIKCRLHKLDSKDEKFDIYTTPFTLPSGRNFDLGLYFDLINNIRGSYNLEFIYNDIYMNEYMQIIPIKIFDKEFSIDFYQAQVKVEDSRPVPVI